MPPAVDLQAVWNFATALLIGALLGIERERHKREYDELTIGGLRTFILFALIGALGGWLTLVLDSPWILAAALIASLAPVLAGYVISARTQPDALGLTTELAAIAACLLGAMTTLGYRELAVGLGVIAVPSGLLASALSRVRAEEAAAKSAVSERALERQWRD